MKIAYWMGFILVGILLSSCAMSLSQKTTFHQIEVNDHFYKCSVGYGGIKPASEKKEGDRATPAGIYPLRVIYYRPDRIKRSDLVSGLPIVPLEKNDGWCDDVNMKEYNQPVKLPFKGSHEKLWRDDHVYDIIVVIGYNDHPPIKGKGSAIFFHLAREKYTPTVGCVAVSKEDMLKILPSLTPDTKIEIGLNGAIKMVNS